MKTKAIWWLTPSLLEAVDGPWGSVADCGHDPAKAWRKVIDWAARLKVERIATSLEPYRIDRIVTQWGFHYICKFPRDAEARCFDPQDVQRNIDIARQIAAYGQRRDVRIMLHHFNFVAPERWIDANEGLAAKLDAVNDAMWGRRFHLDRLGFLVGHVCWNDPGYRAFMDRCWCEAFTNVPELAGILVTPGEFSYCRCQACGRPGSSGDIFDHLTNDERDNADPRMHTAINFLEHFQKTMVSLDREAIIFTWGIERYMRHLPDSGRYAAKFAVFDAGWIGPDPVAEQWANSGKQVLMTHAIESENSGPMVWHDEQWNLEMARRLNAMRGSGTLIHINVHWGHAGHISTFTAGRNIQRTLEHLEPAVEPGDSLREFSNFFGENLGRAFMEAARLIAAVPLGMTSVVHLKGEGYTHHLPPWFDGPWRWPGVLGYPEMDPPPWANPQGRTTLTELMNRVQAEPTCLEEILKDSAGSVIEKADQLAASAAQAMRLLQSGEPIDNAARCELEVLRASAAIAHHHALEIAALLRARLAWHGHRMQPDQSARTEDARRLTAHHLEHSIAAIRAQLAPSLQIAQIFPDYLSHVATSRETFYRLPLATHLKIRERELHLVRTSTGPIGSETMNVDFRDFLEAGRSCDGEALEPSTRASK